VDWMSIFFFDGFKLD